MTNYNSKSNLDSCSDICVIKGIGNSNIYLDITIATVDFTTLKIHNK